jgi:hypothetical protein
MTHQELDRPYVQFICHPYECPINSSVNTRVTYDIMQKDIRRDDMLEHFQYFMQAVGYHFDADEHIAIISENDL